MNKWGDSFTKQADLMEVGMREYFKYIKKEFVSYKEVYRIIIKVNYKNGR